MNDGKIQDRETLVIMTICHLLGREVTANDVEKAYLAMTQKLNGHKRLSRN